MTKISFLGLGVMGAPMAGHLAKAGHGVTVYNRTAAKAEHWVEAHQAEGQEVAMATTPGAAAKNADVVITCVGNDHDLAEVVLGDAGALAAMGKDTLLIDHTTVSPAMARQIDAAACEAGILAVDAPVSGGQAGAENGALAIMCGGSEAAMARAEPIMQAYAARIVHVGGAGAGQATKAVNQICIAGVLAGLSEAVRFADASDLDMGKVLQAISGGAAPKLADGKPLVDYGKGRVRLRLCSRLDAQGSGNCLIRSRCDGFDHAGYNVSRSVLCRGSGNGWQQARHQLADPPPTKGFNRDAIMKLFRNLTAAIALSAATPAMADTLIDNIQGISVDRDGEVTRFSGMVISDDGKIGQILHRGDVRPELVDFRLDGEGRVVLPGMIDAHGHVMGIGIGALTLDLSDTNSLEEAQAKIAAFAAENPSRPWILGRGWNQEKWGLGRFPTAAELDEIVSDRPVWLERVDGHASWGNTAALNSAGVTAGSKSPPGGKIERLPGSRKPSGVFVDAAADLVNKFVPAPRPARPRSGLRRGATNSLRAGRDRNG